MPVLTRVRNGQVEYLGRRDRPIKTKAAARWFWTRAEAERYLAAMPPDSDRQGWIADSEYGPSSVDGSYRY